MANHARTTSFDRAAIMRRAHRYAQSYKGRDWSYAYLIKHGLKMAWVEAKEGLTSAQRRAEAIKVEIDGLKFKSLQINTMPIRARLEAELSALAA